jgi:branched-chain amino acid transport system permease protein
LGQAVFFGVAAYISALVLKHVDGLILQVILIFIALLLHSLIAFILATLVFRGRNNSGPYFTLITLAVVMFVEQLAGTMSNVTGGFNGLSGFQPIAGLDPFGSFYYLVTILVVIVTATLMALDKLPLGLVARAVQDNEPRLQLLGYPTHVVKGLGYGASAFLGGLAGVLFASHQGIVTPTSMGFLLSTQLVIWAAVGGRFHVLGPLLGSVVIGFLSSELRGNFIYWEVLIALIFFTVVLKAPGGFLELIQKAVEQITPCKVLTPPNSIKAPELLLPLESNSIVLTDCKLVIEPVSILRGVNFQTQPRGVLCVIGPNGAGKTSLFNVITGNLSLSSGQIEIGETEIANRPPYKAIESGIGRKMQVPSVFPSLTVRENLTLSILVGRSRIVDYFRPQTMAWRSGHLEKMLSSELNPVGDKLTEQAGHLPQGHKQFLEFTMATASEPRILLLDEPCAGLSLEETNAMTKLVKAYQEQRGGLVIVIEHDMSLVESLADQVLVMHNGKVFTSGTYQEIQSDEAVAAIYVGGRK